MRCGPSWSSRGSSPWKCSRRPRRLCRQRQLPELDLTDVEFLTIDPAILNRLGPGPTAGKKSDRRRKAAGVQLHVALSVVGTEHLQDSGYFRAKLAQETLIKNAPIPYTLLRATQFMEFLRSIAQLATEGNTVRLSHAFIQPMAAEDVAAAVVEAALAPPANGMIEVGGPEKFHLDELVARVLEYDKDPRKVVIDPDARYSGVKLSENSLIPGKDAKLGSTKFDWWLENVAPPPKK